MAAPKPMTFLKVFLHLHKFLRSKVNLHKQNKFCFLSHMVSCDWPVRSTWHCW